MYWLFKNSWTLGLNRDRHVISESVPSGVSFTLSASVNKASAILSYLKKKCSDPFSFVFDR